MFRDLRLCQSLYTFKAYPDALVLGYDVDVRVDAQWGTTDALTDSNDLEMDRRQRRAKERACGREIHDRGCLEVR
jgi:hypothetical protein